LLRALRALMTVAALPVTALAAVPALTPLIALAPLIALTPLTIDSIVVGFPCASISSTSRSCACSSEWRSIKSSRLRSAELEMETVFIEGSVAPLCRVLPTLGARIGTFRRPIAGSHRRALAVGSTYWGARPGGGRSGGVRIGLQSGSELAGTLGSPNSSPKRWCHSRLPLRVAEQTEPVRR
jgi:hypothetical protein